jgi:hypothetical protein
MGATGALANVTGNDVWQQGVGPSVNSDVPTTDINGVARSGATCNPGAFEADGFVAPTVLTRTIGSGKDYSTFTLAEAAVTSIGSGTDLTFYNEAIVFEADAGTYNESVTFSSTLTTDATRQVTYKPAAGSEHGGSLSTGVRLGAGSYSQNIQDSYTALSGLSIEMTAATNTVTLAVLAGQGVAVENCLLLNDGNREALRVGLGASAAVGSASEPLRLSNCVFHTGSGFSYVYAIQITTGSGHAVYADLLNCTIATNPASAFYFMFVNKVSATLEANFVNCISFATKTMASVGSPTITGSNNFGGSTNPFPVAIQGSPYPITPTTSFSTPLGSGDYAVYMGATGALADVEGNDVWQHGIGPALNSDVPTTDINGVERSGTRCNPGAFEADGFVAPTVLTRTIGSGKDYASFTLAEADVENIGGSADLTFENEAIVFEADAGTYTESVTFQSTLTTDATRNVTYKPAAGSEHGGVFGAGVDLVGMPVVTDNYTTISGIQITITALTINWWYGTGVKVDSLLIRVPDNTWGLGFLRGGSLTIPSVVQNCVFELNGAARRAVTVLGYTGADGYAIFSNCTVTGQPSSTSQAAFVSIAEPPFTAKSELYNCIVLTNQAAWKIFSAGTHTVTGSNNFGGSTEPFPVALQGTPYPITPTTNTSPGAGDWAIYDADTGALVYDSDNDVLGQGIGPAGNSAVPTTDILGNTRSGAFCDPGAFEASPAIAKSPGGTLVGGYVPVGTYDVVPDSFPEAVEEAIPLYSSTSQALYAIRPIVSSETKAGNISTRTWTLQYRNASRSEYSRVLELYALSKGGAEGLYWNNQNFTRGGSTETVVVRMSQGPLKATRSTHGRYKFTVKLEEMRYAP